MTRHPSGTGPYEFVSWSADTLKMKKNEHYWKPGLPKIDTITYRSVPENGARIAMLQAGEAQFIYPVPPEMIKALREQPDDHGVRRAFDPDPLCGAEQHAQAVRRSAGAPGAELCDRQAGVRQGGVQRLRRSDGFADAAGARVLPEAGHYPYDPAKAKALLAEAGYPNGFETTMTGGIQHADPTRHAVHAAAACRGRRDAEGEPLEAGVLTAKIFKCRSRRTRPS